MLESLSSVCRLEYSLMIFFQVLPRCFGIPSAWTTGMDLTAAIESGQSGHGDLIGRSGAGALLAAIRSGGSGVQANTETGADNFQSLWMEALSTDVESAQGPNSTADGSVENSELLTTPIDVASDTGRADGAMGAAGAGFADRLKLADRSTNTLMWKGLKVSDTRTSPSFDAASPVVAKKGTGGSKVMSLTDAEKPAAAQQTLPTDPMVLALATPVPITSQRLDVSAPKNEQVAEENWGVSGEQTKSVERGTVNDLTLAAGLSVGPLMATLPVRAGNSKGDGAAGKLEASTPASGDVQEVPIVDGSETDSMRLNKPDTGASLGIGTSSAGEDSRTLKAEKKQDIDTRLSVPQAAGAAPVHAAVSADAAAVSVSTTGKDTPLNSAGPRFQKGENSRTVDKAHLASSAVAQASQDTGTSTQRNPLVVQQATSSIDNRAAKGNEAETEPFQALDAAGNRGGQFSWTRAGAHEAEAGFNDPVLGWVSVRAEPRGGGVQAAVLAASPESAWTLRGEMSGVQAHLAERQISVQSVSVGTDGGTGMAWNGSSGEGSHSRDQGQAAPTQSNSTGWTWSGGKQELAATETERAAVPALSGSGRHISVRV